MQLISIQKIKYKYNSKIIGNKCKIVNKKGNILKKY